jgi:tRNA(Ile)-lysidine synthase
MAGRPFTPQALLHILRGLAEPRRYFVAYSGGLDSHVLLHALSRLRGEIGAELRAVHVNHGLHEQANRWVEHCRAVCEGLDIPLVVCEVDASPQAGESGEAAARRARYAAIGRLLEEGDALLSAHHCDDQAETFLLQALRGGGVHGQAAMPAVMGLGRGLLLRPLLDFTREQLHAYGERNRLQWVDDPSNSDTGFDRNYLRHEVMPALRARWPAAVRTLARAAGHAADAARLADALARSDLEAVQGNEPSVLSVADLIRLPPARRDNVLRYWLRGLSLPAPSTAHLQRIAEDLLPAPEDAAPCVDWPGAEVRRFRDRLQAMAPLPPHDRHQRIRWQPARALELPGGTLVASRKPGEGMRFSGSELEVRFRSGGERIVPHGREGSRSLKKLFQEWGVPPWLRDRIPLIYRDGELAAVAGYCVAASHTVSGEESGLVFSWSPKAPIPH